MDYLFNLPFDVAWICLDKSEFLTVSDRVFTELIMQLMQFGFETKKGTRYT